VRIRRIEPGSPAEHGGLQEGDLVLAINGTAVAGIDDVVRLLNGDQIDQETQFLIFSVHGTLDRKVLIPSARP
jgi:S1-C subfamily serine protease